MGSGKHAICLVSLPYVVPNNLLQSVARMYRTARYQSPPKPLFPDNLEQLSVRFDAEDNLLWLFMQPEPRPNFNPVLLNSFAKYQQYLTRNHGCIEQNGESVPVKYQVLASATDGVFNYGGDLNLFHQLILRQDRGALMRYALACIDILYPNIRSYELPLTTIALVQGDALGGGFEAALSCNIIIAERSAQFGLPEILFNLFPGMGAYSLLARKSSRLRAEEIILSGKMYYAEELLEMGIVDKVVPDGTGRDAVYEYTSQVSKRANGHQAVLNRVRNAVNPVTYKELVDISDIWVDTALKLTARDLRMIQTIVKHQNKIVRKSMVGNKKIA